MLAGATMLFTSIWATVVNKAPPGALDLGGGVGALFAGAGAAIRLKRKDEASTADAS